MSTKDLCAELGQGLGMLFTCEPRGDFLRIRTPYPNCCKKSGLVSDQAAIATARS